MLIITIPVMIILAITAFLFNNFYNQVPESSRYSSSANFMLYHQAMFSYAVSNLATLTPPQQLNITPPYFASNTVTYQPMGNYLSQILIYNKVKYIVSSFDVINANSAYALKTINAIATQLQTPNSGTSQNYQVKIALINNGCANNPTILNSDLNGNNVVNANYQNIFKSLCSSVGASGAIKTYVLMEAVQ